MNMIRFDVSFVSYKAKCMHTTVVHCLYVRSATCFGVGKGCSEFRALSGRSSRDYAPGRVGSGQGVWPGDPDPGRPSARLPSVTWCLWNVVPAGRRGEAGGWSAVPKGIRRWRGRGGRCAARGRGWEGVWDYRTNVFVFYRGRELEYRGIQLVFVFFGIAAVSRQDGKTEAASSLVY